MADRKPLDPRRDLAAFEDAGSRPGIFQLWVGGVEVVSDAAKSGEALEQYQVAALIPNGTVVKFIPGTHTKDQVVIVAQPVNAAGVDTPYWNSGRFNHEALVWPAGTALDTYAERKALLVGAKVQVGHLN